MTGYKMVRPSETGNWFANRWWGSL